MAPCNEEDDPETNLTWPVMRPRLAQICGDCEVSS